MQDLSEKLKEMGQEIHVVTVVPPPGFPKTEEGWNPPDKNGRIHRVRVPQGLPSPVYAILSTFGLFLKTLKVTLKNRVDLILATVPNEDSGLAGWLAAKITGRPIILDVRDDWEIILIEESQWLTRLLAKIIYYLFNILYASADTVVCTSETLRRRISIRKRTKERVLKITNGARLEMFSPIAKEEIESVRKRYAVQGTLAVFAGTLSRHQAPWNIVNAANELESRGVKVSIAIAGGGPLFNRLKTLSQSSGEPVKFSGPISRSQVNKLLLSSDIGIITLMDNVACRSMIPLKFFDYVAARLPIVASVPANSEIAQIIQDNKLGIVVEPENPRKLAAAIEKLVKNKNLQTKYRKEAKNIAEDYDWERIAGKYLNLIFPLVKDRH